MELSAQIKKYRTDMNLSQEELAEKIYVTRQTISNWENDKSYPDITSQQESGKRPYQQFLLAMGSAFTVIIIALIVGFFLR